MKLVVLGSLLIVSLAACGSSSDVAKGTLDERACAAHLKVRAKEGLTAGPAERTACVAALGALKARSPSGHACAVNNLPLVKGARAAERRVVDCELETVPRGAGGQAEAAQVEAVARAWAGGLVGDGGR